MNATLGIWLLHAQAIKQDVRRIVERLLSNNALCHARCELKSAAIQLHIMVP